MEQDSKIQAKTSLENNSQGKVPFISKLAYGMGDVGCNFSWMFVGNFLMIFYTDFAASAYPRVIAFEPAKTPMKTTQ